MEIRFMFLYRVVLNVQFYILKNKVLHGHSIYRKKKRRITLLRVSFAKEIDGLKGFDFKIRFLMKFKKKKIQKIAKMVYR